MLLLAEQAREWAKHEPSRVKEQIEAHTRDRERERERAGSMQMQPAKADWNCPGLGVAAELQ